MRNWITILILTPACLVLGGVDLARSQDWPQWWGPNRDNKVSDFTAPKAWPKELTKKWRVTVGKGESSAVLVGGKVYVFARQAGDEVILCLDAASGKEIWQDKYTADAVTNNAKGHPGPRGTPAVADGKICTLGVGGVVSCLDAATGKVMWRKETKSKPQFYTSYSPMIVDGNCIVYAGPLSAYDLATGEVKWQWTGGGAPYGSPALMVIDGVKQIVTPTMGSLAGIAVADGQQLWQVKIAGNYDNTMSTPVVDGDTVYYSGPTYGAGAFRIDKAETGAFGVKQIWKADGFHKYSTPVLSNGKLFGLVTAKAKTTFLQCLDAKTGTTVWEDKSPRGECGHILNAGSVMLALTSDTQLTVFEPGAASYKELARYKVADKAGDAGPWSCPIVTGNRIFVKDGDTLTLWTIE